MGVEVKGKTLGIIGLGKGMQMSFIPEFGSDLIDHCSGCECGKKRHRPRHAG